MIKVQRRLKTGGRLLSFALVFTTLISLSLVFPAMADETQVTVDNSVDTSTVTVADTTGDTTDQTQVSVEQTSTSDTAITEEPAPEPVIVEPTPDLEPVVVEEPVVEETPAVEPTVVEEPIIEEPVVEEPVVEEPIVEEPVIEPQVAGVEYTEPVVEPVLSPELSTDKADYYPGETATIFGRFFQALQNIFLKIFGGTQEEETYTETTQSVIADDQGSFTSFYTLDSIFRPLYTVTASDTSGNQLAQTTFTDAPPPSGPAGTDFSQCSNNNPTLGNCVWIGSIVQSSNSVYFEGMTVPQRLLFRDTEIADGTHHITFTYQYTKAGIHAYDFLTTVNPTAPTIQGNTPPETLNPCANLGGADTTACNSLNPSVNTPTAQITIPPDPFNSKDSAPAPGTGTSQATKESNYETANGGASSRKITVYAPNSSAFSSPSITLTHSPATADSDTGDTDVTVDITFTSSGCSTGSGCNYLLYFGGHLALTGANNNTGSNWGPGLGSSQISGGPYHIKSVKFDGSGGSLDNQIKGADILVPNDATITIIKDTVPDDPQNFSYSTTGGLTPSTFDLDDDADGILPNTQTFTSLAPGTYTVTEVAQAGFDLTNLNCVDPTSNTTVNLGTGTATIDLAASESVTCTYTNTKRGTIIVEKQTDPDQTAGSFTFTGSASGTISDGGQITVSNLVPGQYTSTETNPAPTFALTGIICDDGASVTPSTLNIGTRTATFELDPGETVKCTFTNTLETGHIVIVKDAVPNDPQNFTFTNNFGNSNPASFDLDDDADGTLPNSRDSVVTAGTYSVSETVPAGWNQTSATCSDGSPVNAIVVSAGETVTCTFTNTKKGHLIVQKTTNPTADPTVFTISASGTGTITGGGAGTVTDALDKDYEVTPGTYSVAETVPAGWDKTGDTCQNVVVAAGETQYCLLTNVKRGHIIVDKVTDPSGDPQSFAFTTTGTGYTGFSLTDAATPNNQEVVPGAYTVSETALAGWDLTSATCDLGETPGSLDVGPGETVTCTFSNQKDANIIVEKQTLPDGDQQVFDFDLSYGDLDADLSDGQTDNSGDLDPGTYSVWENVPAGWDLTSAVCSDQSDPSSISLQAGETVTCVFTNTKRGHITIEKQTLPDGDQATFTFTGDVSGTLTDNGTSTAEVVPGTYSSTETVPSGWDLTNITCDDSDSSGVIGTGVATFIVDPGEDVTCTFTNTKRGHIIVDKVTDPSGDPQSFTFTTTGAGYSGFSLTDAATPNNQEVVPGAYTVSETALAGWDLTSATCDLGETPGSLDVGPGETVTCTFSNQKDANIIVEKQTDPEGDQTPFDFTTDYGSPFTLADNGSNDSGDLDPGTYSVAEGPETGWDLTSATCSDGSDPSSIGLSAGETVTCTFSNQKDAFIIVEKQTLPDGDQQVFDFDLSYGDLDADLSDGQTDNSGDLDPGTYSAWENVPAGWDFTSAICSDGSPVNAISLQAGETVTCVFTNTKRGHIIVDKVTDPAEDPQSFSFTTTGAGYSGFSLTDVAAPDNQEVASGAYSVVETVPAGWDLTSATCDQGETPASLDVGPGETVTCSFTNTKLGKITIVKDADPNDCKDFSFAGTNGLGNFVLDDDTGLTECIVDPTNQPQSKMFENLAVNTSYTVTETVPNFWTLTSPVTCTGVDSSQITQVANGISINLLPGNEATCTFVNEKISPTRTQGFWQTHTSFTSNIFATYFAGGMPIGTAPHKGLITNTQANNQSQLFGAYYSNIAQKSTGKGKAAQRTAIDKARMQLLQQLVTAKLNCAAFGGCPASITSIISNADAAYAAGTSTSAIITATGDLDAFNNSGDTIIISPPLPAPGKATPKTSQSYANLSFWDNP